MDRCRPNFAIELIEKVKHVFNVDGLVFVVATDTKQFKESIKAIYGSGFDSATYLKRFFDKSYTLPEVSCEQYVNYVFKKEGFDTKEIHIYPETSQPLQHLKVIASSFFRLFGFTLRDIEQCLTKVDAFFAEVGNERVHVYWLLYLVSLAHRDHENIDRLYADKNVIMKIEGLKDIIDYSGEFKIIGKRLSLLGILNEYKKMVGLDSGKRGAHINSVTEDKEHFCLAIDDDIENISSYGDRIKFAGGFH